MVDPKVFRKILLAGNVKGILMRHWDRNNVAKWKVSKKVFISR